MAQVANGGQHPSNNYFNLWKELSSLPSSLSEVVFSCLYLSLFCFTAHSPFFFVLLCLLFFLSGRLLALSLFFLCFGCLFFF